MNKAYHSLSENELTVFSSFNGVVFPNDTINQANNVQVQAQNNQATQAQPQVSFNLGNVKNLNQGLTFGSNLPGFISRIEGMAGNTLPLNFSFGMPSLLQSSINFSLNQHGTLNAGFDQNNIGNGLQAGQALNKIQVKEETSASDGLNNLDALLADKDLPAARIPDSGSIILDKRKAVPMPNSVSKRVKFSQPPNFSLQPPYNLNQGVKANAFSPMMGNHKLKAEEPIRQLNKESISKDLSQISSGERWTKLEESVCLHLVEPLVKQELKVICLAANYLGVNRKKRAIDHKLKRLVGFSTWKDRKYEEIIQKSRTAILLDPAYRLNEKSLAKINQTAEIFKV